MVVLAGPLRLAGSGRIRRPFMVSSEACYVVGHLITYCLSLYIPRDKAKRSWADLVRVRQPATCIFRVFELPNGLVFRVSSHQHGASVGPRFDIEQKGIAILSKLTHRIPHVNSMAYAGPVPWQAKAGQGRVCHCHCHLTCGASRRELHTYTLTHFMQWKRSSAHSIPFPISEAVSKWLAF